MELKLSESDIQRQILDYLEIEGFLTFSFAARGTHHHLRGSVPDGWPDIVAIRDRMHIYFEVKSEKGKLTRAQELIHLKLWSKGIPVFEVRSLEEARDSLLEAGFKLRAKLT